MPNRPWAVLAGLALAANPAFSLDVAGAGEDPGLRPSRWWVAWGNDYQGNAPALRSDDFRTNRFDAGLQWGAWRWIADWSNLTIRAPQQVDPVWGAADPHAAAREGAARIDEASLAAQWCGDGTASAGWWWGIGPGLRVSGDQGGAGLQSSVHTSTATHGVRLGYEHRDWRAYPALSARGGGDLPCGGPLLVQVRGATFATTRVEVAAETGVRFGLASGGNAVWLGPLYAFRAGSADSVVARGVADHERGLWLAGGLETPGVVLSVGNQLGGDAVEGRLTVREVLDRPSPAPWPCEAEAGVIPWGHQPRANEWTLRALVGWPSEHPLVQRLRGTIEGLRGELDLPNTYDMSGSVRRVLAGVQLAAWPTPEQGPVVQPYLGVAAGLQRSEVHNESHYGVTEERVARTAVASGEAGVRLGWSGRSWRSGATVAWAWVEVQRDVEVPWRSAGEEGTSVLAADGPEGHLRWWVAIGW